MPQADIRDEHGKWLRYGRINLGAVRGCSECKPCLRNGYPLTRNDEAAPVGFSRRAQNPPPLGGGGSESFSDIRMHPRIRLRDILMCVFLMPVWGITALLRLDYHLRAPKLLKLFRCPEGKKGVVSDTTIARVLRWTDQQQSAETLLAPCSVLNLKGLLQRRLMPKGPSRRLAVFDGSQAVRWPAQGMGDHYLVAALLCGKVNYPLLVEPCISAWVPLPPSCGCSTRCTSTGPPSRLCEILGLTC